MVNDAAKLALLGKIAQLKADLELKKLAAFNQHVAAARNKVAGLEDDLQTCYRATAPLNVPELRSANAQAGRAARELRHADAELKRLLPRYASMRQLAVREFGRASAISDLTKKLERDAIQDRYRKEEG